MVSPRLKYVLWWRRSGVALRIGLFLAGVTLLSLLVYLQRPQDEQAYQGNNLLVFLLVNFNIVVLLILAFLVGRNIVKLVFDRRRRILGSKLRMRLVVAFVGLTLVPTVILFILASGLLSQAMEGWFSGQVEKSVTGAVDVAKLHYKSLRNYSRASANQLVETIEAKPVLYSDLKVLKSFLEDERVERNRLSCFSQAL